MSKTPLLKEKMSVARYQRMYGEPATDHPHTREAIERWHQGKINVFDALAELEDQRDELRSIADSYRETIKELTRLLEIEEESDNGNRFYPNRISSCRTLDGMQINQCLKKLKELASE